MSVDSDEPGIRRALTGFYLAHDESDYEGLGAYVWPDVRTHTYVAGELVLVNDGLDAMIANLQAFRASHPEQRRHLCANVVVDEVEGDEARSRCYTILMVMDDGKPQLRATGLCRDRLVRDADRWRIRERHIYMDSTF